MSDYIRFTISKHSNGNFSAYSRLTGKHFEANNKNALWTTMRQKLGANRHWVRKEQWVVLCRGIVSGTNDTNV